MFKIGEFSKLSQVPVKTLRYYDELGLLRPARSDPFTSYRYYSASQLPRLNRILALKDLGLSLEQIAQLLAEGLPPAQLRGMLRLKQIELQERLEEERARLARVENRLREIEEEECMSTYEVVLKKIPPMTVATIRAVLPAYPAMGQLFAEVFAYLGQQQVRPAGPPLYLCYDEEYREHDVDVEVAVPVAAALPAGGRVACRELRAETMAAVVHQGSYEGLHAAYAHLLTWIEANGYRITGPNREIYIAGPAAAGPNPAAYITEVQFPVTKG